MAKLTEEYLIRKIANCKELIETATSDAQRTIYEGYLNFWIEKGFKKVEVIPGVIIPLPDEPIEKFDAIDSEAEFKAEFPNKQAYYSRNGEMHMTKAFKEFLNKETQ